MKNVVITGASTGIGYATTVSLVKRGYRVFGSVRKKSDAERLQDELGQNFEPLLFDVTDNKQIQAEAARLTSKIGQQGLTGLINNAGIAVAGPIMHLSLEELRHQMNVNVIGLVATTQAFLPLLGAQKNYSKNPGRILNVSSVAGKIATPFMGAYCASKHAVEAISDSLRIEMQLYDIPVIVIGPGVVKTPIWQKAEEIDLTYLQETDYAKPANKIIKILDEMSKDGFDQAEFGEMMADIFETKNPQTRYALVPKKLQNWTLPRLLPTKLINTIIGKRLGLSK